MNIDREIVESVLEALKEPGLLWRTNKAVKVLEGALALEDERVKQARRHCGLSNQLNAMVKIENSFMAKNAAKVFGIEEQ